MLPGAWARTWSRAAVDPDEYVVCKPLLTEPDLVPIIEKSLGEKAQKMIYESAGIKERQARAAEAARSGRPNIRVGQSRGSVMKSTGPVPALFPLAAERTARAAPWAAVSFSRWPSGKESGSGNLKAALLVPLCLTMALRSPRHISTLLAQSCGTRCARSAPPGATAIIVELQHRAPEDTDVPPTVRVMGRRTACSSLQAQSMTPARGFVPFSRQVVLRNVLIRL